MNGGAKPRTSLIRRRVILALVGVLDLFAQRLAVPDASLLRCDESQRLLVQVCGAETRWVRGATLRRLERRFCRLEPRLLGGARKLSWMFSRARLEEDQSHHK